MISAILYILAITGIFVIVDALAFFFNRKCKYCGKRMIFKGNMSTCHTFVFFCPHCHRYEYVDKSNY